MNYYDFALKDYKSAITMKEHTDEYDVIVVSCQQYFEKAFKRILELKCGQLLKTHKITTIVNAINIEEFNTHQNMFRKIQDYYFDKRYPGEDYITTTKEEMLEVYNFMLDLKPVIEKYISMYDKEPKIRTMNVFDI